MVADRGNGTPWWSVIVDRLPDGDKIGHLGLIGKMSFLCNLADLAGVALGKFGAMQMRLFGRKFT